MNATASIQDLPDECLLEILKRLSYSTHRNAFSLVCKRFFELERLNRLCLNVGLGLHPVSEALTNLFIRFPSLKKIKLAYGYWTSKLGPQINDSDLRIIAEKCQFLEVLSLEYCSYISDAGLSFLTSCLNLESIRLNFIPGITGRGLLSVVSGCVKLIELNLICCNGIRSSEWLDYLGRKKTLLRLMIANCRGIGEGDLARLGSAWNYIQDFKFVLDSNPREVLILPSDSFDTVNSTFPNLEYLKLENCPRVIDKGFFCLMAGCKNLKCLKLTASTNVCNAIVGIVVKNCSTLRILHLNFDLRCTRDAMPNANARGISQDLLNTLSSCSMLEELELKNVKETSLSTVPCIDEGIKSLSLGCLSLHSISIQGSLKLTEQGFLALSQMPLLHNISFERLKLKLSDIENRFPLIRSLNLKNCSYCI